MDWIGMQLLEEARREVISGEKDVGRRDLLSLLVKSNMSEEKTQRLSDEVVVARALLLLIIVEWQMLNVIYRAADLLCGGARDG
jgi:cytochrome P450